MPHEPSRSRPPLQLADRRCLSCRTVEPLDAFPGRTDPPVGYCMACRRSSAVVARRHRQQTLRQVGRRAEVGYRTLLAQRTPRGGGGDAA
jgi:hypothetical protein